jgi:hypothetical protein
MLLILSCHYPLSKAEVMGVSHIPNPHKTESLIAIKSFLYTWALGPLRSI